MMLAMSGATRSDSGLASGLVNTTLQVGGAIGLAVLATLATTRTDTLLADGESTAAALTSGYHLAFLIGSRAGGRRDRGRRDRAAPGRSPAMEEPAEIGRSWPRRSRRTPRRPDEMVLVQRASTSSAARSPAWMAPSM